MMSVHQEVHLKTFILDKSSSQADEGMDSPLPDFSLKRMKIINELKNNLRILGCKGSHLYSSHIVQ